MFSTYFRIGSTGELDVDLAPTPPAVTQQKVVYLIIILRNFECT